MTTKVYASGGAPVTVRDPDQDGFKWVPITFGAIERCLDGTARQHVLPTKRRWSLKWSGLTSAEYVTLMTQLSLGTSLDFIAPDGATVYDVLVSGEVQAGGPGYSYTVTAELEEE